MKRVARSVVAVGSIVCLLTPLARAGPVTFEFAGRVTDVGDPENRLGGSVSVGDPFGAAFTFESTTPDTFPDVFRLGSYQDSVLESFAMLSGFTFAGPLNASGEILVGNRIPGTGSDGYSIGVADVTSSLLPEFWEMTIYLLDPSAEALSDDSLPLVPLDLALFAQRQFILSTAREGVLIFGEVTSFVPEPSTLMLLAAALAMARRARRWNAERGLLVAFVVVLAGLSTTSLSRAQSMVGPVIRGGRSPSGG